MNGPTPTDLVLYFADKLAPRYRCFRFPLWAMTQTQGPYVEGAVVSYDSLAQLSYYSLGGSIARFSYDRGIVQVQREDEADILIGIDRPIEDPRPKYGVLPMVGCAFGLRNGTSTEWNRIFAVRWDPVSTQWQYPEDDLPMWLRTTLRTTLFGFREFAPPAPSPRIVTPREVWSKPSPPLTVESFIARVNAVLYEDWSEDDLGTGKVPVAPGRAIPIPDDLTHKQCQEVLGLYRAAGWRVDPESWGTTSRALRFWLLAPGEAAPGEAQAHTA